MLHLVRAEVLAARRYGKPQDVTDDEWAHVTDFLREVETPAEPGDPNWIRPFASFRDVADALRATLRLSGPLRRRALEANLIHEIVENAKDSLVRGERLWPAAYAMPNLRVSAEGALEPLRMDWKKAGRMVLFRLAITRSGRMRSALDEAVNSGEFLDYDAATNSYVVGSVQTALLDLRRETVQLEHLVATIDTDATMRDDLTRTIEAGRTQTDAVISGYTAAFYNAAQAAMLNALGLGRALYRYFRGIDSQLRPPELLPAQLTSEEQARVASEAVTSAEAEEWLRSST